MIRSSLDNPKTYHSFDESDVYDYLSKFSKHFEKGFHEAHSLSLPTQPSNYKNFLIASSGKDKHLAGFANSLTPFFLNLPFSISTGFRLPSFTNKDTFVLVLASSPAISEIESITAEADSKNIFTTCLTPLGYSLEPKNSIHIQYQNPAHSLGFLLGLFFRFNPDFAKTQTPEKIFSLLEKTVEKLSKETAEKQNPAKLLAQKHSQKAILLISSGHLVGVAEYISGLITNWSSTFSTYFSFPESKYFLEKSLTHPTKVLSEYQVLMLDSELYPNNIKHELNNAKQLLAKKRINYTQLMADNHDWLEQIIESVVFLSFFSYYLSITNKVKL